MQVKLAAESLIDIDCTLFLPQVQDDDNHMDGRVLGAIFICTTLTHKVKLGRAG